jgi:surfeit locus 1 family protein
MSEYNAVSGQRRFRPRLLPAIATIVLLPVLVWLGVWQLERADEKRDRIIRFEAGATIEHLDSTMAVRDLAEFTQFQQVQLDGRYDNKRQFLLDNMTDGGSAGYHILTLFRTATSQDLILVDRGWIAKDFRSALPPDITVAEDQRTIIARVSRLPRPGIELAANPDHLTSWPRVVQFPTAGSLSAIVGEELIGPLLLLNDKQPDGYLRDWRPAASGVDRHMGYALQWFAMAATLLVIYVVVNFKKKPHDNDG